MNGVAEKYGLCECSQTGVSMLEGAVQNMSQKMDKCMDVCFCLFTPGPRLSPCQREAVKQVGKTLGLDGTTVNHVLQYAVEL